MKILLDERLPRRLDRDLNRHSATTVPRQGWAGVTDAELPDLAGEELDVLLTTDSNPVLQQNLKSSSLCTIVPQALNSRYETL